MQKVIRRTILAEKQAGRRLAKKKDKYNRGQEKTKRENALYVSNLASADIKRARAARREEYDLGPLAPRRDVGTSRDTYGTVNAMRLKGQQLTMEQRLEMNPETGRYANIVPEDRVVLLEGRDKGKIGKVRSVSSVTQEIIVEGLNLVCTPTRHWIRASEYKREQS
jgi:large subunit ribosomal protein L24